jgi:oligogalacturonide lyase
VRLSDEGGSSTLYFHDTAYTPEGDKFIFNTPNGIAMIDVAKIGTPEQKIEIVATGGRGTIMARKSREVYISRGGGGGRGGQGGPATQPAGGEGFARGGRGGAGGAVGTARGARAGGAGGGFGRGGAGPATQPGDQAAATTQPGGRGRGGRGGRGARGGGGNGGGGAPAQVFAINIDTKAERLIPNAVSTTISCDETWGFQVANGVEDPTGKTQRPPYREPKPQLERMFPGKKMEDLTLEQQYSVTKEDGLARRAVNPEPAAYTFINLKTGERKTTGYQYGNLNHQQWNPVIPDLLLYAHEGTWHEVDRTWTINASTGDFKLMHKRTMDMEINGHEWWSFNGKTIWTDLQTPRSEDFWILGINIDTMKETRYHLNKDTWGVHFNSSRDDTMFMSDGGDPSQVAYSQNGQWINLFRVQPDGSLAHERLVHMWQHRYVTGTGGVEPNGSITPDKKWVIFTGQFDGDRSVRHVYAVEIARSK